MARQSIMYSPYGAYEMKSQYQKNWMIGTGSVVGFVALLLFVSWVYGAMQDDDMVVFDSTAVVIKTIADLGPPPSIAKKPPQVKVQAPDVAAPKVGIPKPVADDEVLDEDVVLATRDELAEIIAPDIMSEAGDDIVVDIDDDDFLPSADQFVPVEIQPEMIHYTTPEYPRLAKQAGIEGTVWVKALISKSGNVIKAQIGKSSGTASLDDAAVEAAKDNKFKPGIQNGRPINVWVTYKVDFSLSN